MIELRTNPSARELRWFGVLVAVFCTIFGLIIWGKAVWLFGAQTMTAPIVIWSFGALFCLTYYAVPPLRRWMYAGWILAVFPIGWVVSHVVLAAVYYVILTPIGLLLRLFGKDPMHRRIEPDRASYWIDRGEASDSSRYFRQF
ncbi:MAG: SxtJ family membrane protein [Planctomycetota bacterium]